MKKLALLIFTILLFENVSSAHNMPAQESLGTKPRVISTSREIVFIHGMFMTSKSWDGWMRYFGDDYTVSAPAWPMRTTSEELKQQNSVALSAQNTTSEEKLSDLTFKMVLDSYRKILLPKKDNPPILIGHSMGGLIAQILLSEGLGSAAIVIDSAPTRGVFVPSFSFLKANWGSINPFANSDRAIDLSKKKFTYAFTNTESEEVQKDAYDNFYVPESRRVGRGPLTKAAHIEYKSPRGPLLMIAGGTDHIVPAKLNYATFKRYELKSGDLNYTEFRLLEGRDHWTIAGPGWENVALSIKNWLQGN